MTESKKSLIEALGIEIATLEEEMKREKVLQREIEVERCSTAYRERISCASEMMQLDYTEGYAEQMMRYSKDYSSLPSVKNLS